MEETNGPYPAMTEAAVAQCRFEGCERDAEKRGWCGTHYMQWYRNRQRLMAPIGSRMSRKRCQVSDCPKVAVKDGYCTRHP